MAYIISLFFYKLQFTPIPHTNHVACENYINLVPIRLFTPITLPPHYYLYMNLSPSYSPSLSLLPWVYVQSQPCVDEWNYAKSKSKKVVNLMLGGSKRRTEILELPLKGAGAVAPQGGAAIQSHFTSEGQAPSVYDDT